MAIDTSKLAKAIAEAAREYERQYGHLPAKARVTLSKSESEPWTPSNFEQAAINKAAADMDKKNAKREVLRKYQGNLQLAEAAEEIQKRDSGTYEQALLAVLNDDPSLYQE